MRRWFIWYGRRLGYSALAALLILAAAEGVVRLGGWGLLPAEKYFTDVYDPNYRMIPGAPNPYSPVRELLNGGGFVGRLFDGPKPPGVVRIIDAGDSTTFGVPFSHDKAYTHALEQILIARGEPAECMNAGVPGTWLLPQVMLIKQKLLPQYRPDILILYTGVAYRTDFFLEQEMRRGRQPMWRMQRTLAHFHLYRLLRRWMRPPRFADIMSQYHPDPAVNTSQFVSDRLLRTQTLEDLAELRALCARYQVKCLVIPLVSRDLFAKARARRLHAGDLNWKATEQTDRALTLLRDTLAESGLHWMSIGDEFLEESYRTDLFYDAIHFSVAGHRFMAGLLADELCRLGWLPRPCGASNAAP
jgi:hypothetical protein